MDLEDRAKQVIVELLDARLPTADGHTQIDLSRVRDVVRRDPDCVAFAIEKIMGSPHAGIAGWGVWMIAAQLFEAAYDDDSLVVLVERAAAAVGQKLPELRDVQLQEPPEERKLFELQMAEADVAAGDAYRMLMVMRLDTMPPEVREKLIGNCIITFPAAGDPRPVQHIPRVRAFVADLHRRLPYFPLFLNLDRARGMQMVYFGCLADPEATKVGPGDAVAVNAYHRSMLEATRSALAAISTACAPLRIDWSGCAQALLAPYDEETRELLLGAA